MERFILPPWKLLFRHFAWYGKVVFLGIASLSSALAVTSIPGRNGSYLEYETFNASPSGAAPSGWTTVASGGTVAVSSTPSLANKSVQLLKVGTANAVSASRSFTASGGKVVVEIRARFDAATGAAELPSVYSSDGTLAAQVLFSNGNLYSYVGATQTLVQAFNVQEWYVVRLEIDTAADTYDLYVDGIKMLVGQALRNPVSDIAKVTCAIDAGAANGTAAYFDSPKAYTHAGLIGSAPTPLFDIASYGAVGDGSTVNTAAIQAAIDACAGTGGSVYIHDGTFVSGTITLKSNMTLWVEPSARLLGSPNSSDYPIQTLVTYDSANSTLKLAFILLQGATDVRIDGGGIIDGNGTLSQWHVNGSESTRPLLIYPLLCDGLAIQNVYLKDSACWGVVPTASTHVAMRNIVMDSNDFGNRDGTDIVDCQHVLIEDCTYHTDDDVICPKSGTRAGVDDLTVRNLNIWSVRANGLKMGTSSYGSFTNSTFDDILIKNCGCAGIAIEAVDGADIANITYRGISMKNVASPVYAVIGDRQTTPTNDTAKLGSIDSIVFSDVVAVNTSQSFGSILEGSVFSGKTYAATNVGFRRCVLNFKGGKTSVPSVPSEMGTQYPEYNASGTPTSWGLFLRHIRNVTLTNTSTNVTGTDARSAQAVIDGDVTTYGDYQWTVPAAPAASFSGTRAALSWTAGAIGNAASVWAASIVPHSDASIVYAGTWTTPSLAALVTSPASDHLSGAANSTATFAFTGTGVRVYATLRSDVGTATVSVDGGTATSVDPYAAATQYQQVVFEKTGLTAGSHTVVVKSTGSKNASSTGTGFALDGFRVAAAPVLSYNVKRASLSGGPYTTIATTSTASYADAGVAPGTTAYYVVTAAAPGDETPPTAEVSAANPALPVSWQNADVGTVAAAGNIGSVGGVWTLTGSGTDLASTTDGLQYACLSLAGDGQIVTRVTALDTAAAYAGLMLRSDLTAGSVSAFVGITSGRATFLSRAAASATAATTIGSALSLPSWFRLVRAGNAVTGSISADGISWTQVGTAAVPLATPCYVGLAVSGHGAGSATAVFDNVAVTLPSAPTGLAAVFANGTAALSWNAVPGATGYNVKRATVSGGPYATVASPAVAASSNSGLTSSQTYYYVVSELLNGIESANSVEAAATDGYAQWLLAAGSTPGAAGTNFSDTSARASSANGLAYAVPGNLSVVAGSGSVTLSADVRNDAAMTVVLLSSSDLATWTPVSWSAAAGQGGVAAGFTRYTVQDLVVPGQPIRFYRLQVTR